MPKPALTRVTWSGVFGSVASPLEVWQFSLNLGDGVFADQANRDAVALAMSNAYAAQMSGGVLPTAILTRTRVAQVGADGLVKRAEDGAYLQADDFSVAPGSGTGANMPFQIALAVSLVTARPGPTGKGRFYLPAPAVTLGTDGRIPAAAAGSMASRAKGFVEAVDAAWVNSGEGVSPGGNVIVASTLGFASIVTGVRVGRVLDTQRRRRGDLLEEWQTLAVAQ